MTPEETVALARIVRASCPQQKFDEYTPDAWHDLLGDLSLNDCRNAVRTVAARQPFVSPSEIRAEVQRIRSNRLHDFQYVPVEGDEDPEVYLAALREQKAAVADGRREAAPALESGEPRPERVRAVVSGAFRRLQ